MGTNILPGATLVGGQAAGDLSQYYGSADTTQTTVNGTTLTPLSSVYTIPAGEPYAGAAYSLDCGGTIVWGTGTANLSLNAFLNSVSIHTTVGIADGVFASGSTQVWKASLIVVSADGVSQWLGGWTLSANQVANNILPGTAADNTVTVSDSSPSAITVVTSAPITVALRAAWSSTGGAPSIINDWTVFRKIS